MPDPAWFEALPPELTIEYDGKTIPLREHSFVKESPDLETFAKRAYDAHREVGARIPIKVSKPEEIAAWKQEHLPKLYKAGILDAPLASPDLYEIKRPEKLPEGLGWNDDLSKKFATTLHKHGAPKALAGELLTLYEEALLGEQKALKTSYDAGMAALKTEHGDKFEERQEVAKRLITHIFKTPEELEFFEATGMGDHPGFLSVMMRLAPLAVQDSSFLRETARAGGEMSGDDVRVELAKIMSDKAHPMYEGYKRNDPKVLAHVEELYKKAYGDAKVTIGEGVGTGG